MTEELYNDEVLQAAVDIITEKILTPVLYMYIEEVVEFICFSDSKTPQEDFDEAERAIYTALGLKCEIVDIREFDEADRLEITKTAEAVYTADPILRSLLESAMAADVQHIALKKAAYLERKNDTGTYYVN